MQFFTNLLVIVSMLSALVSFASAGVNCKLNSASLSCLSTDTVTVYPGQDPAVSSGMGLSTSVSLIAGAGCSQTDLKSVHYSISVPTHFDYCSVKPLAYTGCNTDYSFSAVNTTFFSSSFLPTNTAPATVTSKLAYDAIEAGCEVQVSMNFLWIHNVPKTCKL